MQTLRPLLPQLLRLLLVLTMLSATATTSRAQTRLSLADKSDDDVIRKFIAGETRFRDTLLQFNFRRDVVLQTLGPSGEVTGEYIRNSDFVLDDRGKRFERVLYHPSSTIKQMKITKEDVQDLAGSQLLGLEVDDLNLYTFTLLGRATLDGREVYAISVNPKQEPDPHKMRERFFVGTIWIDAESFQIVKLRGITEPHGKQRFPTFQTVRNLRVEDLMFPATTVADEVLRFPNIDVHYRIAVRYHSFKRFASQLKIVDVDDPTTPLEVAEKPQTNDR
ncbi:MAG TPA: hypothetical protein VLL54_09620 [Pyrinomonadaceae bacterium]|nr:hypothetical protein [Pyrinomonadaceae bacterium]